MRKYLLLGLLCCSLAAYSQAGRSRTEQRERGVVAVIPFQWYGHHLVIPALVSGSTDTLHFIFDTGAEVTVLHYGLMEKLHIQGRKKAGMSATNDLMLKVSTATLNALYLDQARLPFLKVYLENIPEFRKGTLAIDGFIGVDLLRAFIVKIDYARQQLVLYRPGADIPVTGATQRIPFRLSFHTPVITATIQLPGGQSLSGNYLLTTGGDYGILFNWPYTEKHRLDQQLVTTGTDKVQDLFKELDYINSSIPAMRIGALQLQQVPVSYCKDVNDDSPLMEIAGAAGCEIWKQCPAVIIDYARKTLYLQ
ncbi:aspartyl protease family protein [Chitinophaga japonensis]|uniref:Aspartyl protease n=1 Tax=Chitinophaga japonensis TaxID=104662 RepID=A0A562TDQ1_CHIJA|nr:aspartyl protease family protein [Chitinophaga japonensis]TWI91687.1 aspartyl protease [Chitinophaga japonensis]